MKYDFSVPAHIDVAAYKQAVDERARERIERETRTITAAATTKFMEAEASLKASAAIVQVHIDRIVALELEVARLRAEKP